MSIINAAKEGKLIDLKKAYLAGEDIKKEENGGNALHWASYCGHSHIVAALLEYNCDIESKSKKGWTPLALAVIREKTETVRFLLQKGASPLVRTPEEGLTLYQWAKENNPAIAAILLENTPPMTVQHSFWNEEALGRSAGCLFSVLFLYFSSREDWGSKIWLLSAGVIIVSVYFTVKHMVRGLNNAVSYFFKQINEKVNQIGNVIQDSADQSTAKVTKTMESSEKGVAGAITNYRLLPKWLQFGGN